MDEVVDSFNPHAWAKTDAAKSVGPLFPGQLQVVAFGGGTDSAAVLIGLRDHGLRPDRILFSDTGGEQERTYDFVRVMSAWTEKAWGVPIERVVRTNRAQEPLTLEGWSLAKRMLPSLAYGFKSCSLKFKVQPQDKAINNWAPAKAAWKRNERVVKHIGYEAGEVRRVRPPESKDGKYLYQYPLIAWGWDRAACLAVIRKEGLPMPGKSACFFCPAMKKPEILALSPELKARALVMEDRAREGLTSVKGLGRYFSWREFLDGKATTESPNQLSIPCECFDGTE